MDRQRVRSRWLVRERWNRGARFAGFIGAGLILGFVIDGMIGTLDRGQAIGGRAIVQALLAIALGGLAPWWLVRWIGRRVRHYQFDR